jgi:hypothetical protein
MNRKYNISRVLILLFIFSGLTELTLDCVAANVSSNNSLSTERPEFQRFLKSHNLPGESNFSRTKTESGCEQETDRDAARYLFIELQILELAASVSAISRTEIALSYRTEPEPMFLRNRQFRI